MKCSGLIRRHPQALVLGCVFILCFGCGDGGTGSEDDQTGATLQGQIILFGGSAALASASADAGGHLLSQTMAPTNNVDVSIGNRKTTTDANGSFMINHIPLGDNSVRFSGSGISANYSVGGVKAGNTIFLQDVQVNGGQVKTKHTGTWLGTAGSTDPGSQGQIAFTLIIAANGNALTGTASIPAPDNSRWTMSGTETGSTVEGSMELVPDSSNSPCATGATFTGSFVADTLAGTFVEVDPPSGCGTPESGIFRVVKQQQ